MTGKKKIDEDSIVALYIDTLVGVIKKQWDKIISDLKDLARQTGITQDIKILNEREAIDTFFIANIAISLQTINNLFPKEQSKRLQELIIEVLDDEQKTEINNFTDIYNKAVENIDDPIYLISSTLLYKWLGQEIRELEKKVTYLHLIIMYIEKIISGYGDFWNNVKVTYKLT